MSESTFPQEALNQIKELLQSAGFDPTDWQILKIARFCAAVAAVTQEECYEGTCPGARHITNTKGESNESESK